MDLKVSSVMIRYMCEGYNVAFQIPCSMSETEWISPKQNAVRKEITTKSAGHPTVFTVEEEHVLAARLKDFAERVFRCTPKQIRIAAFLCPNMNDISHPWDKDKIFAGKERFSDFLKRNDVALRKPEGLARERAQVTNQKAVANFLICVEICVGNQRPWHATLCFQYRRDSVSF